jgi:hypothetical protein
MLIYVILTNQSGKLGGDDGNPPVDLEVGAHQKIWENALQIWIWEGLPD